MASEETETDGIGGNLANDRKQEVPQPSAPSDRADKGSGLSKMKTALVRMKSVENLEEYSTKNSLHKGDLGSFLKEGNASASNLDVESDDSSRGAHSSMSHDLRREEMKNAQPFFRRNRNHRILQAAELKLPTGNPAKAKRAKKNLEMFMKRQKPLPPQDLEVKSASSGMDRSRKSNSSAEKMANTSLPTSKEELLRLLRAAAGPAPTDKKGVDKPTTPTATKKKDRTTTSTTTSSPQRSESQSGDRSLRRSAHNSLLEQKRQRPPSKRSLKPTKEHQMKSSLQGAGNGKNLSSSNDVAFRLSGANGDATTNAIERPPTGHSQKSNEGQSQTKPARPSKGNDPRSRKSRRPLPHSPQKPIHQSPVPPNRRRSTKLNASGNSTKGPGPRKTHLKEVHADRPSATTKKSMPPKEGPTEPQQKRKENDMFVQQPTLKSQGEPIPQEQARRHPPSEQRDEDVFTLYTWSVSQQPESKILEERKTLHVSIMQGGPLHRAFNRIR